MIEFVVWTLRLVRFLTGMMAWLLFTVLLFAPIGYFIMRWAPVGSKLDQLVLDTADVGIAVGGWLKREWREVFWA